MAAYHVALVGKTPVEQSLGLGGARTSYPSLQLLSRGPCPAAQPAGAWQVLGTGQGVRMSQRGRDGAGSV